MRNYYEADAEKEWRRLDEDRTEFAVSLRLIQRFLGSGNASVIDIGGGPGRYAIALSELGHAVHLLDLAQANVDLACARAAAAGVSLTAAERCDARDLSHIPSGGFDAALIMGPLYHLLTESDRSTAIAEARRVVRPLGLVFASFVCRFAPFRLGANNAPERLAEIQAWHDEVLRTGRILEGPQNAAMHLAHPDEIVPSMAKHSLQTLGLFGCQGIGANSGGRMNALQGRHWEAWVEFNLHFAAEPALLGASSHLMYVGRAV